MRKLTLSLAVMAALLPGQGYSLGLGELELHSALNQELNAEVEVLSAATEDSQQLLVKLANREAFARADLDRPFFLQQLKFKVIDKNGTPYVKIYTKVPIKEPFLSFLLEIDWPQGHLLREYTLLLDPPVYNSSATSSSQGATARPYMSPAELEQLQSALPQQQNSPAVQSSAQVTSAQSTTPYGQASAQSQPQAKQSNVISSDSGRFINYRPPQSDTSLPRATSAEQYRVQQHDTLWSMANRMRPDSAVSVEQMMLALVRKNPEAFIHENINGVKRGYILRMPNREEATQLDRQQAIAQAREHSALWREYSAAAVSSKPASAMEHEDTHGDNAGQQPPDADGHLSIVGASEHGSEKGGANQDPDAELSRLQQDLAMAMEELESTRLEKEDLRSRLAELEQRVKRVIELDDGELAQLQSDLASSSKTKAPDVGSVADEVAAQDIVSQEVTPDETPSNEAVAENEVMPGDEVISPEDLPQEESLAAAEDTAITEDALFVDEIAGAEQDIASAPEEAQPQALNEVEPPVFAQEKPKGFFNSLMDDPKLFGMIGGGLAFILLLVGLIIKRVRGKKEESQWSAEMDGDSPSDLSDVDLADFDSDIDSAATVQTSVADMDATSEMDAGAIDPSELNLDDLGMDDTQIEAFGSDSSDLEDTVFSLDGAEAGAEEDEDERDDVLAEADVYLAYGIYQQAEELLITAIEENPGRDDYRMKLLETHFASKNSGAFAALAEDLQSSKGDDKTFWDRVVVMGMELCPDNNLFNGSDMILADFDADALLPDKPQTTDFELDSGEDSVTDFDLGLDDVADPEATQILSEPVDLDTVNAEPEELDLSAELEELSNSADELIVEDDNGSELEFDLGDLSDSSSEEQAADSTGAAVETESNELDIDDDFSLDFDASDLGFEELDDNEESDAETLDIDEGLGTDEDLDLAIDLDDAVSESELDVSISDEELDLGELELDEAEDSDIELDMDLDDLDLATDDVLSIDEDLDQAEAMDDVEVDELDVSELDEGMDLSDEGDEFDISELSEEVDEVSTKLDLARAYIDMGDNDGARSILQEVKSEGNDEQIQQAEELLQKAS